MPAGSSRPSAANRRATAHFSDRIDVVWSHGQRPGDIARAVADQDAIVHLAFAIPPESEEQPERAEAVNVGSTRNVIAAA
jgi:nucleoside-diphosphate-sugar epimerase